MGKLFNVKEAIDYIGVSESTFFRMLKNKEISGFKVGRQWKFEEADLIEFVKRQREKSDQKVNDVA